MSLKNIRAEVDELRKAVDAMEVRQKRQGGRPAEFRTVDGVCAAEVDCINGERLRIELVPGVRREGTLQ